MRWPLLLLAGCTFEPGTGFVTLTGATLDVRFEPGEARDLGDGRFLTDQAHTVRVDRFELTLADVALEELQGAGDVAFDPADPPPGYSLCHGGHCHADDGRLVDYVEIEAELSGGQAELVPMSVLPVGRAVDLLVRDPIQLEAQPAELPLGRVDRVAIGLERVVLEGEVEPDGIGVSVDLPVELQLSTGVDIPIDRDQAPAIALEVIQRVDGTLLDGLDLSVPLALTDPDDPVADAVLDQLLLNAPAVRVLEVP